MDKRYQVFVSSTYVDLVPERSAVIKAILDLGHIPVGMEMFSAADEEQWQTIKREIDRSDYYLVMAAHRYGSTIKTENNIGYTEKEFDYAVSTGIPRLGFVIQEGVKWEPDWIDSGALKRRLDAFKRKIKERPVSFWEHPTDLTTKVTVALSKITANTSRPGWRRGNDDDTQTLHTINLLTQENIRLREEVDTLRRSVAATPILDCQFIDENGQEVGSKIEFPKPSSQLRERVISKFNEQLKVLVGSYDQQFGISAPHVSAFGTPLLDRMLTYSDVPYKFDLKRADSVIEALQDLNISPPVNPIEFSELKSLPFSLPFESKQASDVSSGADYQKYKAFQALETAVKSYDANIRNEIFQATHEFIWIRVMNTGTLPVDDLIVRLSFDPSIEGTFNESSEKESRFKLLENISSQLKVQVLIPSESVELKKIMFRIPADTEILRCEVKVAGRQLPSALVFPLEIRFVEEASD